MTHTTIPGTTQRLFNFAAGPAVLGCLAPGVNYRPLLRRVAAALEEAPWPVSRSLRWTS